jgi:hypothetical protein
MALNSTPQSHSKEPILQWPDGFDKKAIQMKDSVGLRFGISLVYFINYSILQICYLKTAVFSD